MYITHDDDYILSVTHTHSFPIRTDTRCKCVWWFKIFFRYVYGNIHKSTASEKKERLCITVCVYNTHIYVYIACMLIGVCVFQLPCIRWFFYNFCSSFFLILFLITKKKFCFFLSTSDFNILGINRINKIIC